MFNATGLTAATVAQNVIAVLKNHRRALEDVSELYAWSSGIATADLQAIGFSATDAAALLSAIADAHAEYLLYATGLPPSTYPQPARAYVYAATQSGVIGPSPG